MSSIPGLLSAAVRRDHHSRGESIKVRNQISFNFTRSTSLSRNSFFFFLQCGIEVINGKEGRNLCEKKRQQRGRRLKGSGEGRSSLKTWLTRSEEVKFELSEVGPLSCICIFIFSCRERSKQYGNAVFIMNLVHLVFRGQLSVRMSQTLKRSCLGGKSV